MAESEDGEGPPPWTVSPIPAERIYCGDGQLREVNVPAAAVTANVLLQPRTDQDVDVVIQQLKQECETEDGEISTKAVIECVKKNIRAGPQSSREVEELRSLFDEDETIPFQDFRKIMLFWIQNVAQTDESFQQNVSSSSSSSRCGLSTVDLIEFSSTSSSDLDLSANTSGANRSFNCPVIEGHGGDSSSFDVTELQTQIGQLRFENQKLIERNGTLNAQLAASEDLVTQLKETEEALSRQIHKLTSQNETFRELPQEISDLQTLLAKQTDEYSNNIAQLQQELTKERQARRAAEDDVMQSISELETLQFKLQKNQQYTSHLRETLITTESQRDEFSQKCEVLESEILELSNTASELRRNSEDFRNALAANQAERRNHRRITIHRFNRPESTKRKRTKRSVRPKKSKSVNPPSSTTDPDPVSIEEEIVGSLLPEQLLPLPFCGKPSVCPTPDGTDDPESGDSVFEDDGAITPLSEHSLLIENRSPLSHRVVSRSVREMSHCPPPAMAKCLSLPNLNATPPVPSNLSPRRCVEEPPLPPSSPSVISVTPPPPIKSSPLRATYKTKHCRLRVGSSGRRKLMSSSYYRTFGRMVVTGNTRLHNWRPSPGDLSISHVQQSSSLPSISRVAQWIANQELPVANVIHEMRESVPPFGPLAEQASDNNGKEEIPENHIPLESQTNPSKPEEKPPDREPHKATPPLPSLSFVFSSLLLFLLRSWFMRFVMLLLTFLYFLLYILVTFVRFRPAGTNMTYPITQVSWAEWQQLLRVLRPRSVPS